MTGVQTCALPIYVVSIPEATELLLSCRVPDVEADGAKVGEEGEGVDLDSEGRYGRVGCCQQLCFYAKG